jgi:integrase
VARPLKGTWDSRRSCYVAALGDWYTDGSGRRRRRVVALRHEDGSYVERWDDAGRLAALARLRGAADRDDRAARSPTVADLFRQFVDWHRITGTGDQAVDHYRYFLTRIANVPTGQGRVIGDLQAASFGVAELFAVRAWVRSKGGSESYVGVHERVLKNCFRWASRAIEGRDPIVILAANPFPTGHVKGVGSEYRSERPCPTWEELQAILDRLDEHITRVGQGCKPRRSEVNALMVRVIAERGCRPLEVCRLKCEEWDDAAGGFVLKQHKTSAKGVAGVIPLRAVTAERVRALLSRDGHRGVWVFGPTRGPDKPPSRDSLATWWRDNRDAVGAGRYELYSFRNTVSNHLRLAGIAGRELQLAIRHTPAVADGVYRRDTLESARQVFERAGLG